MTIFSSPDESRSTAGQARLPRPSVTQVLSTGRSVIMTTAILVAIALLLSSLYYLLFALVSQGKWV